MKYFIILILLTGCSDETTVSRMFRYECNTEAQRKTLAKFVVDCAKAANPMSDEEGEDLVQQCEATGKNIICPSKIVCNYITRTAGLLSTYSSTGYGECK